MHPQVESVCIECQKQFCCADCRRKHEFKEHKLTYECEFCRYNRFTCSKEKFENAQFVDHFVKHLPLQCARCNTLFNNMKDIFANPCTLNVRSLFDSTTIEVVCEKDEPTTKLQLGNTENEFDNLYDNILADVNDNETNDDDFEAILSLNKSSRTAVITPVMRAVSNPYSVADAEHEGVIKSSSVVITTPYPFSHNKLKFERQDTPHIKKTLVKQKNIDETDEGIKRLNPVTDSANADQALTVTPKLHLKEGTGLGLASAVAASTPTHPCQDAQWPSFQQTGADSPLSEIEGTNADNDSPQSQAAKPVIPQLKSIMRLGSQDSAEKSVTFASSLDSDCSASKKRVKFAQDTKFGDVGIIKRAIRKPKRVLTPGPPLKKATNPRFLALLNKFERGKETADTPARTVRRYADENQIVPTPEPAVMPARAIEFKDADSPNSLVKVKKNSPADELYVSCTESSPVTSKIKSKMDSFTNDLAATLQTCISNALECDEESSEIQFKFVISKRKVTMRKIVSSDNSQEEKLTEIERTQGKAGESIFTTITNVIKNVFWKEKKTKDGFEDNTASTTPLTSTRRLTTSSSSSSGSKRKLDQLSLESQPALKRHKYEGRIRGRRPLDRMLRMSGVTALQPSFSADQPNLIRNVEKEKDLNQSF